MNMCTLCSELRGRPSHEKPHDSLNLHSSTAAGVRNESEFFRRNYRCSKCGTKMRRSIEDGDFVGEWKAANY